MRTALPKKARRELAVVNAGANRGALGNLDAFASWNRDSSRLALVPHYIDPVPGRAALMKAEAAKRGVAAEAVEGTIEGAIAAGDVAKQPILLNLDSPRAIAETVLASEHLDSPLLGYLLVKLPSGELWGVRFYLRPGDTEGRRLAVKFFHRLGELTARRGSSAIVGAQGNVAHRAAEARYRAWFAAHTQEQLGKLLAGTEPSGHSIEVTDDGGTTTYALLIEEGAAWSDPRELAERVAADPPAPILRGESWVIAEVVPDGLRFHKVRRRKTDDKVALHGLGVIDNVGVDAERQAREAAEALRRAASQTVSRRQPVLTTD